MSKGTCVHFCGSREKTCGAGVNVREITGGPDLGWFIRIPCHKEIEVRGGEPVPRVSCEKYREPTPEELAEDEAAYEAAHQRMMLVMPLMGKIKKEHKGKDARGVVECPVCKGKLHYSHAKYNGHVHGRCETEGCLNWME